MRYFVAVAEELHFGRAAQRLHMAQSPLSRQILDLERAVGFPLLERTTRRVELTPAGDRFLDRCRSILTMVDKAARTDAAPERRVRVGFTGSATYEVLPALAERLRLRYPNLQLDLQGEMLTPAQEEGLLTGALDVGILRPPVSDPRLSVHLLRNEPLIAVLPDRHRLANPGQAVALTDLADEYFVTYPADRRSVLQATVEAACSTAGFRARVIAELAETSAVISYVAAGLAVSVVPASAARLQMAGVQYAPLSGDPVTVALAVAVRAAGASPLALAVRDHARALLLSAPRCA